MISSASSHDLIRFIRAATRHPLRTGAVMPSGHALASMMVAPINPHDHGPVIELGPGTGTITQALIDHGINEERLILVESNPEFQRSLSSRFPRAHIWHADAYDLAALAKREHWPKAMAVVSSLPLRAEPAHKRRALITSALHLLKQNAPFIQYSYSRAPPVTDPDLTSLAQEPRTVWWNIPPARVWVYRASPATQLI